MQIMFTYYSPQKKRTNILLKQRIAIPSKENLCILLNLFKKTTKKTHFCDLDLHALKLSEALL